MALCYYSAGAIVYISVVEWISITVYISEMEWVSIITQYGSTVYIGVAMGGPAL